MQRHAVIDWEKGKGWDLHYQDPGYAAATITGVGRDDLAAEIHRHRFTHVGVETAHLVPRGDLSVAQVYTQPELEALYAEVPGVLVLLDARAAIRFRKGDGQREKLDALLRLLRRNVEAHNVRRFRPRTDEDYSRWDRGSEYKKAAQEILNRLRPDYIGPEVEALRGVLTESFALLPPDVADELGIRPLKMGPRKGTVVWDSDVVILTLATIAVGVSLPRVGWSRAKDIYSLHAHGGGAGLHNLVRANLTYKRPNKGQWSAYKAFYQHLQAVVPEGDESALKARSEDRLHLSDLVGAAA